ncbi:uncharacterized protein KD926_007721 [Aspergillus affinis]|uniref:uncharacterized protein n=1 Tax=Aspergillus affinis TaxID=1070780 RepID=UPI0022FDBDB5|nr:uncharacterized protein KD926_007721 [Aspergillus affinis]KAI9040777.1 hypothetical protein KD926_007721 [Aspergillus affinis]
MKSSVLCSVLFVALAACAPTKQVRGDDATMNMNMDMAMNKMENENMAPSMDRMANMNDMNNNDGMDGMSHMENMHNMNEAMDMKRESHMPGTMNKAMDAKDMADGMIMDMGMDKAMKRDVQDMNEMNKGMDQDKDMGMSM